MSWRRGSRCRLMGNSPRLSEGASGVRVSDQAVRTWTPWREDGDHYTSRKPRRQQHGQPCPHASTPPHQKEIILIHVLRMPRGAGMSRLSHLRITIRPDPQVDLVCRGIRLECNADAQNGVCRRQGHRRPAARRGDGEKNGSHDESCHHCGRCSVGSHFPHLASSTSRLLVLVWGTTIWRPTHPGHPGREPLWRNHT